MVEGNSKTDAHFHTRKSDIYDNFHQWSVMATDAKQWLLLKLN